MSRSSRQLTLAVQVCLLIPSLSLAGDALESDPSHHRLEFENDCVRVIRAFFNPGEKSDALFDAKAVAVVSLTGSKSGRLLLPDGRFIDLPARSPGETWWAPAGRIGVENTSDAPFEYLVVEPQAGCEN
jgi:hypothetical protein